MAFNRGTGYTITEVLIVLAVSSAMFISATVAFRGRQQQVQFDQAVRDFESQIIDIINDVSTGFYPSDDNINCSISASVSAAPIITPATTANPNNGLGTSRQCLYIGKALHFQDGSFEQPLSDYRVINLVGKRFISSTNNEIADTIEEVIPKAIESVEVVDSIRYGVEITKIVQPNTAASVDNLKNHDVVVFLANFEGGNVANSTSQSQNVKIAGVDTQNPYNRNKASAITTINALTEDSNVTNGYADFSSRNGVILCIDDGAGRVASISVGESGASSTNLRIGNENIAEECA